MITAVTGASGHLGGNLVRSLLAEGRQVRVLVRKDTRAVNGLKVESILGDVFDYDSLLRLFAGAEVVYHCAARISIIGEQGGLVHSTNVHGVRNVVKACLACGVKRLMHFSSVHAYDQHPLDQAIDETRALAEQPEYLAYDRSKAAGEREIEKGIAKGLDAVILNPGGIIGPYDYKPSAMGEVLIKLQRREIPALVDAGFAWVDVRDVVEGAMLAEKQAPPGEKYILVGHWVPFNRLGFIWSRVSGIESPHLTVPIWLAKIGTPFSAVYSRISGSRPLYTGESLKILAGNTHFKNDKAKKQLGWRPRAFFDTLKDTHDWFKSEGVI